MDRLPDLRRPHFTAELGLGVDVEADRLVGRAHVGPELCVPGGSTLRLSVLLTWADILSGSLANEVTLPRVCMTADLDGRVARPLALGDEVVGTARILKSGRTLTFGEATFATAGSDDPAVLVLSTFVASPRPEDVGVSALDGEVRRESRRAVAPRVPVAEALGARVVAPGVVEADRHERLLNWSDTVQGGAVALLAEEAARTLDPGAAPSALQVRYVSTIRRGPMRATARRLGAWTRVDVVDAGNDHRLAAVALVGLTRDASGVAPPRPAP